MKITNLLFGLLLVICACQQDSNEEEIITETPEVDTEIISSTFGDHIDIDNLLDYKTQDVPNYISKDNTDDNEITNEGATLGRVLFYDKNLSVDNSVACASCHQQAFAFSDGLQASNGVNGTTGRHSMRLINSRFADEENFFWDERAASLEEQTTMPIQDHTEMGFSGENGDPAFNDLITKLEQLDYYQELFPFTYGDAEITEERVQNALAQFIRSIQSFDSKYDAGRAQVNDDNRPFPNFSDLENEGKNLFNRRPDFNLNGVRTDGGAGCNVCHRAPEFDIDPNSRNNGVIGSFSNATDTDVTRAPSLRDLFNKSGELNTPLMHTGDMKLDEVLAHYNSVGVQNNNVDRRLTPNGQAQVLNLSDDEITAITAFLKTLSGSDVYTNPMWSDPFTNN
ncbi:MAG: cytochrome c peroxidase [Marinoscillum sp.]